MKKTKQLYTLIVVLAVIMLCEAFFPSVLWVRAGTYGDLSGVKNEFGNVMIDNAVGNAVDYGSNVLVNAGGIPQNLQTTVTLANNGGVMITGTMSNPDAKWYNRPSVGTTGKIIKVGGFFIGTFDTLNDLNKIRNYHSPDNYTDTEAAIDQGLYYTDVGMGLWSVGKGAVIFGGAILGGATVGTAVVAAAGATAGIYAVSRLGVQVTRAMYNAGYFGKIRDGIYWGWDGFKSGASTVGSYTYRGVKRAAGGISWGAGAIKDFLVGSGNWLAGSLMGSGVDGIMDDYPYDGVDGLNDEIPDPSTGIGVYKPNIYIYSGKAMDVTVKLLYEEMITASDPVYNKISGWEAKVRNGSINGEDDYLFYEAIVPDEGFQKDSGWVLKAESLKKNMLEILDLYKFNEKEKADFVEYWIPVLSGKGDFIFYPQQTNIVDIIMPLNAEPTPENIYRIWFYIEGYNGQHIAKHLDVEEINTHNNALVEWGGVYRPY